MDVQTITSWIYICRYICIWHRNKIKVWLAQPESQKYFFAKNHFYYCKAPQMAHATLPELLHVECTFSSAQRHNPLHTELVSAAVNCHPRSFTAPQQCLSRLCRRACRATQQCKVPGKRSVLCFPERQWKRAVAALPVYRLREWLAE